MARLAKAKLHGGAPVPKGHYYEVTVQGQTGRFISDDFNGDAVPYYYFAQERSAEYGYIDVAGNAANLASAVKRWLNNIGETRYDVTSTYTVDSLGYGTSIAVTIVAKEYNDVLNFGSVSYFGDGYTFAEIVCTNAYPPTATATVSDAVCFGSSTGTISLQVAGGEGPYTYEWSDGSTEPGRVNVPTGQYTVTITDSAKPQPLNPNLPADSPYQTFSEDHPGVVTVTINVGQNSQLEVIGSIGNNSIELQVSGGVLPYSFLWNDGVKTKDRTDVDPGSYKVTITDGVGCTTELTFTISLERFFFSKNPVLLQLQASDIENKPNLRFICEVWVEPDYLSGEFILATPEPFEHPADSTGYTQFDVSDILDAFVEPHLPDFNQRVVLRADKCFKRFYLRHTEAYGDPVVLDPFTVQDNRYVLCGGLDAPEHYANTYFTSFRENRKPFFTWEPPVKNVLPGQPEYLYFMPDSFDLADFRVKTKVTYSDGSTAVFTLFTQAGLKRFELYIIPTGHDQLGLGETQPGKLVRQWDIYVVDAFNNVLSETRRYIVDHRSYGNTRFFLYANSIGGYNTLAATGRAKLSIDPQAQVLERSRPIDALSGDTTVVSKYSKRTLQLSTGHKTKAELQALQDFLNSVDVKLVAIDRYITGRLSDKASDVYDEADTLNAFTFDFILAKMHSYTPQLKLGGYTDESALLTPLAP